MKLVELLMFIDSTKENIELSQEAYDSIFKRRRDEKVQEKFYQRDTENGKKFHNYRKG